MDAIFLVFLAFSKGRNNFSDASGVGHQYPT